MKQAAAAGYTLKSSTPLCGSQADASPCESTAMETWYEKHSSFFFFLTEYTDSLSPQE